ncbi:hypothetical protein GUITHDRAFT_147297 [Guillardia theta CCMP2712]|uniref:Uncharacterized protein n=1 Tax=Guillardia theta (strain CCMP2712) TaxID=905079 RepID=L1IDJ0_GUITC|nr:hypothetical protein GUITHDRAFT_147297 [Guillardia theta CCMP2712]EKX34316.1 hypothetical protein GUITHDRAFT_147297 [Guillardia theta CCMP2712]|eukprot:XP_005821296.1 hypothetical protein GUITHDRAFT_147297 [Guillardia theta CCMP2712]
MAGGEGAGSSGEESLSVKVFREQLERKWMLSRIRAKTVFLPFEEAVKWTRALGWWESKEEWQEWIEWGELKNPYIPSNPERYYGERGEWKGWDYWLGVRSGCSPEDLVDIATRRTEDGTPL